MRRRWFIVPALGILLFSLVPAVGVAASGGGSRPLCDDLPTLCTDLAKHKTYEGQYSGHDEPSLLFYSNTPGSGNDVSYHVTLPRDSADVPRQDGSGGTWNFQLRPTFWFGMAMCDTESSPETVHTCTPDSDSNISDNPDPSAPDWVGNHPGVAFTELQFYPPGWTPWPAGVSCTATEWCAALTIDSLGFDDVNQIDNNKDCLDRVGEETVNFAFLTTSGAAHSPAGPIEAFSGTFPALTFNSATDLVMNPGDTLAVRMHDTAAGLEVTVDDLTSGAQGSMTASTANGFAQVIFDPSARHCTERPYAFHPMYSTSGPHTRVEWAAHSYNVAYSDEIGHFEYCNHVVGNRSCRQGNATDAKADGDDNFCFRSGESLLVNVSGCIDTDTDFDGPAYLPVWPGSGSPAAKTSEPLRFRSATFSGGQQYSQVAFETDLVNLERHFGYCSVADISQCAVPPPGVAFYPMFTTGLDANGVCEWREGGPAIPGATNTFGGLAAEWGTATALNYAIAPGATGAFWENFYRALPNNPCPA